MKKLLLICAAASVQFSAAAQAWSDETMLLSFGGGITQLYHINDAYYPKSENKLHYFLPTTPQFNLEAEFSIQNYMSIGFCSGIGSDQKLSNGYEDGLNFPIGLISNFHFYQLIADKTTKNIHADVLDIYAGINAGSGVSVSYYSNIRRTMPIAFAGVQVGMHYYYSPTVGLTAELGFGKSLASIGVVFKL